MCIRPILANLVIYVIACSCLVSKLLTVTVLFTAAVLHTYSSNIKAAIYLTAEILLAAAIQELLTAAILVAAITYNSIYL